MYICDRCEYVFENMKLIERGDEVWWGCPSCGSDHYEPLCRWCKDDIVDDMEDTCKSCQKIISDITRAHLRQAAEEIKSELKLYSEDMEDLNEYIRDLISNGEI